MANPGTKPLEMHCPPNILYTKDLFTRLIWTMPLAWVRLEASCLMVIGGRFPSLGRRPGEISAGRHEVSKAPSADSGLGSGVVAVIVLVNILALSA